MSSAATTCMATWQQQTVTRGSSGLVFAVISQKEETTCFIVLPGKWTGTENISVIVVRV
jgi:hypothetical protein